MENPQKVLRCIRMRNADAEKARVAGDWILRLRGE